MPKFFFNSCTNNTNNDCFTDLIDMLLKQLDKEQKIQDYIDRIEYLEEQLKNCGKGQGASIRGMDINLQQDTKIKKVYILYIRKYGVLDDGLFLPSLLAEFICL